ncbi:MAG: hypothetical protein AAGG44_08970 [Planctomycetota bacterium]
MLRASQVVDQPSSEAYANPYAPSNDYAAPSSHQFGDSNAEAIRRRYIRHEASIRSIGILYYLGTLYFGLVGLSGVVLAFSGLKETRTGTQIDPVVVFVLAAMGLGLSILMLVTGIAIRQLKPWARIVATVFSAIGLLLVGMGTLVNGYFLWLLHSEKGNFIFTPQYAQIRKRTPHIKPTTSTLVMVLLILLILLVAFLIVAAIVGSTQG